MSQQFPGPPGPPPPDARWNPVAPQGPAPSGRFRSGLLILLVVVVVAVGAYVLTSDDDDRGPTAAPLGGGAEEPAGGSSEGPTATEAVGPATQPPTGVPELDQYAQGCHDGSLSDCDSLYIEAFDIQFENDAAIVYTIYSQSCGGRLVDTASTQACTERITG